MSAFSQPIVLTSPHPHIILDSGAYSIWRSGAAVNFEKYRAYCETVKDFTHSCVNLDVIPGAWKRRASPAEVEAACEQSFENWKLLQSGGLLAMPVYHQGDRLYWLDKYLGEGAVYIGISPTDSFHSSVRQMWLTEVHNYIVLTGHKLNQDVFTHCLGVFTPRPLYGLPAWSADASTLMRYVAMKRILTPYIEQDGLISGWEVVATSSRMHDANQSVDWPVVAQYLDSIGVPYERRGARIIIDDAHQIIRVNLALAKRVMTDTGVRCFVAGSHPMAIYTVTVEEKYPYILRTYATIRETTGVTINRVYNRTLPKPRRRPEQDHKVEPVGGLFP